MGLIKRAEAPRNTDERQVVRDREQLLLQLGSEDATMRRMAARDLVDYPDVSEAFLHRLQEEEESSVRNALFSSLTQIGDTEAVDGLIAFLRSEDAELRNSSIEGLKCLPEQVGTHISSLLQDPDPDVRIFTVNILESLPHANVQNWLWQVIETEPHVNVCAAAVDLLIELGTPEMIPTLKKVTERFPGTPYIAFAVDLAIERIQGTDVVDLPEPISAERDRL